MRSFIYPFCYYIVKRTTTISNSTNLWIAKKNSFCVFSFPFSKKFIVSLSCQICHIYKGFSDKNGF